MTNPADNSDSANLIAIGSIRKMHLPEGWIDATDGLSSHAGKNIHRFEPLDADGARLTFITDHSALASEAAQALQEILSASPHELDEQEAADAAALLDEIADPSRFKIEDLRTFDWNGRSCLGVTGSYVQPEARAMLFYFIAGDDGGIREQIVYLAPSLEFPKYKDAVMRCFKTIEWDPGYLRRP